MKGSRSQVENVGLGSVIPSSVPGVLEVYPERNLGGTEQALAKALGLARGRGTHQYWAWSLVSNETGGSTPKASQVSWYRRRVRSRSARKKRSGTAYVDDVGRLVVGHARDLGVVDELDGVRATGVLGDAGVLVVGLTSVVRVRDVLEDGSEADGAENLGLLLRVETDALGVATSLNVEHSGVGPDVLVVADELAFRVGGEGRLSGSGKTEEKGDVPVLALVGGRVERELPELDGLKVVLGAEENATCQPRGGAEVGSQKRTMTEKIPFFISPAYSVPRMTISFLLKLTSTEVAEVMPAVKRLAGKAPALSVVGGW